jgi:propionyl-CoA synthetase
MQNLYGISPGEVWWSGSDIGWVVGHSYMSMRRCSRLHHDPLRGKTGGTPDAGAFWRVISEHGAVALFTAPPHFAPSRRKTRRDC